MTETPLHVVPRGAGQPVVLLHSGGMSSRQWRRLSDTLAADHEVLAPDLLGSGENPPWPDGAPFDHSMDVAAVKEIVLRAGRPVDLVGHSYGGLVALTLARQNPALVRSMVLYDPVAFGVLYDAPEANQEALADLERLGQNPVFSDASLGGTEPWMEAFVDYWNGFGTWRSTPEASRRAFLRVGKKVSYEVRSITEDRTAAAAYSGVHSPTLVLSGERTPAAARRVARLLVEALPSATLLVVPGAGHMGPITHADQVNRAILEHLAR